MSNFVIQGYANLENVNANNMDLFYATMSAQLSTFFPILSPAAGSICNGIGNIVNRYGQVGTSNVFDFTNGSIRFLDQVTNLTTDISIKPCYANYTAASVTVTCPISVTQYYVVAVLSFNTPTDPFTTSTSVTISPTAMTLAQIAAQTTPSLYNPIFAITTTDGVIYTIHLDNNCAFNYGYILGNPFPDIIDAGGLVSIIGSAGLFVENHVACNITLNVGSDTDIGGTLTVGGTFLFDSSGQFSDGIKVLGLASTFYIAAARGGLAIFANSSTEAYLGSNNTSTGGYNGLIFDDTLGRPRLSTPATAITNTGELACIADIPLPGSNADGYFVRYTDGLIEQRGTATIAAGNATVTATLPITVTNIPSNTVLATVGELTGGNVLTPIGNAFLSSSSTIQISVTANFTNSQSVFWSVTGY